MATFVLVPGSWLGAWAWRRVEPPLRAAGHDVLAVTLTGLGDRAHLGSGATTLSAHVQDVVATIEAEELTDVVLVGHSYSGLVVSGVAEQIPERLARVIYLAAALPVDGKSAFTVAGEEFRGYVEAQSPGGRWPFPSDGELARYFGNHGLSADDLAWLRRRTTPHPLGTSDEPSSVRNPAAAALPTTYVRCTEDAPPELSGDQAKWGYAELPTGHWPMITMPVELARLLDETARG